MRVLIEGPVDYSKPNFYWDGTSVWIVLDDGFGFVIGSNPGSLSSFIKSSDPISESGDRVLSVRDVADLIRAAK